MTVAVDLGHKATKQTKTIIYTLVNVLCCIFLAHLSTKYSKVTAFVIGLTELSLTADLQS